jgi:hypothetical protein
MRFVGSVTWSSAIDRETFGGRSELVRRRPEAPTTSSIARTAPRVAESEQQSITMRSGIERSHVNCRLQSWRAAKMPLSRIAA